MKFILWIISIIIFTACENEEKVEPPKFRPGYLDYDYTAIVKMNFIDEKKYINAEKHVYDHKPSRLVFEFISSDDNYNYFYPINFIINKFQSGTYRLHSLGSADSVNIINYYKVCCYSNPDQLYWTYVADESDSLNNYMSINLDSLTNSVSGSFKATLIPFSTWTSDGPDTIWASCDSFFCKYSTKIF